MSLDMSSSFLEEHGYVLSEKIGSNAFAVHRKDEDTLLFAECYDIKPENLRFFIECLEIFKEISHENVVPVIDSFNHDNIYFLISPFVNCICSDDYIKINGPLEGTKLIRTCANILDIITDVHQKGHSFRKISLKSILFTNSGSIFFRYSYDPSPIYLSPETSYKAQIDLFEADMWSVGIVFYFLSTGRFPWPTNDPELIQRTALRGVLTFPNSVDSKFAAVVRKILDVNPESRPSASQVGKLQIFKNY